MFTDAEKNVLKNLSHPPATSMRTTPLVPRPTCNKMLVSVKNCFIGHSRGFESFFSKMET